jgi:GH24 family phage-related lysozyme (muramidase)
MADTQTSNTRIPVGKLTLSAAALSVLLLFESFSETPYIPTAGDNPTIGIGTTIYPDGKKVTMNDPPITRQHAEELAMEYLKKDVEWVKKTLVGALLEQHEFDAIIDFLYQFGRGNWIGSSMRREFLAGNHEAACNAFLLYRNQDGRDCSKPKNWGPTGCRGVWLRQLDRVQVCKGAMTYEELLQKRGKLK